MPLISPKFDNSDMLNPITVTFGNLTHFTDKVSNAYYIDGAGWNGKVSKICVCDNNGNGFIIRYPFDKTNNQCEYQALIELLKFLSKMPEIGEVTVYTDSELMFKQLTNVYKTKDLTLQLLQQEIYSILSEVLWHLDLNWIRREYNKAGKILEKDK